MIKLEDARKIFFTAATGDHHKDYKRNVDLAILYRQLITGENIKPLLQRFVPRESPELFTQRENITQVITPAMASTLMNPAYKIPRVRPVVNSIDFEQVDTKESKDRIAKIGDAIKKYWGELSLDDYIEGRFIDLGFTDPNAWVLTLFANPGERFETAIPYPIEISSQEAWNYEYINNVLQWLLVKNIIPVKLKEGSSSNGLGDEWALFNFYTSEHALRLEQIDGTGLVVEDNILTAVEINGEAAQVIKLGPNSFFKYNEYVIKAGEVPAMRVGYKRDLVTKGRTFVNPFHAALPYFMKSIKTVSEFDITMSLHTFLQKIAYQPKCMGESKDISCDRGWSPSGPCKACKGTGYQIHTSAQDSIIMGIPSDPDKIIDLSKMVHYVNIPIDIVKFQDEYIDKLEVKAIKAMYNSNTFTKDTIENTATASNIEVESVYDTLYPMAKHIGNFRCHKVRVTASYINLGQGIIVQYANPKDFKMKSVGMLLGELNAANTGGASSFVKEEISGDLAEQLYIDKPDMLTRLKVKKSFDPFDGKSEVEIQAILSDSDVLRQDKVLWKNFKRIFFELEEESLTGIKEDPEGKQSSTEKVWFYELPYAKQKELVDAKVQDLMELLDAQVVKITPFDPFKPRNEDPSPDILVNPLLPFGPDNPIDPEKEAALQE